ncbi:MAG: dTMP kinase [Candidatus Thermoplasmatota archaeon]|jgi:thymidylate kinase|nr:dTMP kinase [Candidatus Thermoplasmatota archaeon]
MLVILEGIDNSGKSYQAKALKSKLEKEGTKVNINKEMFSKIRGVTKGLVNEGRIPSLFDKIMNGKVKERKIDYSEWPPPEIIIIDRFIHTVLAYAKVSRYYIKLCESMKRHHLYDLAIYVDITPDEALERSKLANDNMRYSWDYLNSARLNYLKFVESNELILVDGMRPKEEVTEAIISLMKDHFYSNKVSLK